MPESTKGKYSHFAGVTILNMVTILMQVAIAESILFVNPMPTRILWGVVEAESGIFNVDQAPYLVPG
jgi:hypothetical protein